MTDTTPLIATSREKLRDLIAGHVDAMLNDPAGRDVDVETDDLLDALLSSDAVRDADDLMRVVRGGREAFLASPDLATSWIAGWHAATDHHTYALATALTEDPR